MNFLRLVPVLLGMLLLGAHFYRSGLVVLTGLCLVVLFLLFIRKPWVPQFFQVLLVLGGLEWLRTLYFIAAQRIAFEQSWTRLAVILGVVALITALSGLVFRSSKLKAFYTSN